MVDTTGSGAAPGVGGQETPTALPPVIFTAMREQDMTVEEDCGAYARDRVRLAGLAQLLS